jgi:C_GCAxxG_C_C family probable redox protein
VSGGSARKAETRSDGLAAAGAALCYAPEGDEGGRFIQEQIERLGVRETVRALGEFTAEEEALVDGITAAYEREQAAAEWRAKVEAARALGFEYERTYKGCGQCTVAVLLETLGRFDDGVFEAATAFAGGLGHAGDSTCGALIGASMVTSLLYPRRRAQFDGDRENKYCAFSLAQKLRERFVEAYGGIRCQDVHCALFGQAYDLRDAARREAFEAAGAHVDNCTNVVGRAAGWAMEIIAEEDLRRRFGDGS